MCERERERECVSECVRERERESVCVCEREINLNKQNQTCFFIKI